MSLDSIWNQLSSRDATGGNGHIGVGVRDCPLVLLSFPFVQVLRIMLKCSIAICFHGH